MNDDRSALTDAGAYVRASLDALKRELASLGEAVAKFVRGDTDAPSAARPAAHSFAPDFDLACSVCGSTATAHT